MNHVQPAGGVPDRTLFGRSPAVGQDGQAAEDVPLIAQFIRVGLRWKWVILGSIAASVILGLIVSLLMTPLYTATSTIEIARESNKVVQVGGVEQESNSADLEFYQTQYGLLRSRELSERVARELELVDDPAFFEMFGEDLDEGFFAADPDRPLTAADRARRERKAGEILLENLEVFPIRLSRLVELSFTSPDPELSAKVTNAWSANFIESNLERRFEATSYAREFLEDRLAQLRVRLDESERQLVDYASRQRIINLPFATPTGGGGGERGLVVDNLATLNAELSRATADRVRAESRWRQAGGGTGAVPEALENNAITALRQKRAELAADYARMLVQFEPEYPAAQALASQIDELDRSIAREVGRVSASFERGYREALARESELQERVESLKAQFMDLRRRSIQYNIFQRDVDTNRQLYDGLLQRYKEIGVAGGVGTNNVAVVDQADVPIKPSRPRLLLNLALAFLLGCAIGGLLAFGLEQMDEAISDPTAVERTLGVPLLGAIPKSTDATPIEAMQDRKSELVEAYLSVQTNLEFSTHHGVPATMSVTSTRPAEGKSTTAFSLATSLARARKKVVLIDGDMRSPSVHGLLGLSNDAGLSNYLAGNDDVASLIQPVTSLGFSAIPSGPIPPNAAELLTGDRLQMLLAALAKSFDHVIIDSPPVMGLADAPLIASRVESTVFVVESHGIRTSLVKVALGRLRNAQAHIIGTVLTKFESKRAHFGYGYDYGYGYGRAEKKPKAA